MKAKAHLLFISVLFIYIYLKERNKYKRRNKKDSK